MERITTTTVTTQYIGHGDDGVYQTLTAMAAQVRAAIRRPVVVNTSRAIVANVRGQAAQAVALRRWLETTWRFVDDPVDLELLVDPWTMLEAASASGVVVGDCDEAAVLGASLGAAVGITPVFIVLGFAELDGRLCHVYAALLTADGATIELDVTRPAQIPFRPTRREVFAIF